MLSKKKRLIPVCLLLMAMLITTIGCGQSDFEDSDEYVFGQDDQFYFYRGMIPHASLARSEEGYYFFGSYFFNYLHYMDRSNLDPLLVCSKPECLHDEEQDSFKTLDCDACLFSTNYNLVHHDGHLYTFGADPRQPMSDEMYLWQLSLNADELKKVRVFSQEPRQIIIHRGFIYYEKEVVQEDRSMKLAVYRQPLDDSNQAPEEINSSDMVGLSGAMMAYANGVYFIDYDKELEDGYHQGRLMRYDIQTKKLEALTDGVFQFKWAAQRLICITEPGKEIFSIDLDGSNRQTLDIEFGMMYGDAEHLYVDTIGQRYAGQRFDEAESSRRLLIYDVEGTLIQSLDIDFLGNTNFFDGGDEHYLFMLGRSGVEGAHAPKIEVRVFNKEDLLEGDVNPKLVYEFESMKQPPGFSVPHD